MPANFNYYELDGTPLDGYHVLAALLPTPYTNDAASAPIWNRDLLISEPKLTSEPKQVVTYEINPKAIWYDGTPITWEDFYWQWKSSNGTNKAYQIASSNGYEDIENVEKGKDTCEVVVTFKHKYADWTNVFNPFYPASTNKDPKIFNEGWKDRPLTTAGPFKLDSIDATSKTITLVRNEKWWGDRAKLDEHVLKLAVEEGAELWRPAKILEASLPEENGSAESVIRVERDGRTVEVRAGWMVDASGRSAIVARRRGWLHPLEEHPTSAAWARFRGVTDLDSHAISGDPDSEFGGYSISSRRLVSFRVNLNA